ncbi:uncharacterized protein LOC141811369 [Halichoeres trimaculatus]|uniref:uncharacterized protein LOC141811369 n=1 Tax=Halichoeres trimaculatus TaxID=147232 RepID=UPI003D9DDE61
MPTAKGKGGSSSHRYRPASEFDDATLAQKREYWRTKKREQRARLSERRGKHQSRGEKIIHPDCSAAQSQDETSNGGNPGEDSSDRAAEGHKERWLQTVELNKVSPQVPASFSISARVSGRYTSTVKRSTVGAAGSLPKAVTSPTASGPHMITPSSVPPARVSRITNGSSMKTPQPCVSMQGALLPKTEPKAQVESHIQPKPTPTKVTSGQTFATPRSAEGKMANSTPQRGTKRALAFSTRTKGVSDPRLTSTESEEERAAKRRELWRIKKREQRAKVAARIAKAREKIQGSEGMMQRDTAQKPGPVEGTVLQHVQSWTCARRIGQKQSHNWVNSSLTSGRKESNKPQGREASSAPVNLQTDQVRVLHPAGNTISPVRKPGDSQRKNQTYVNLSNMSRGPTRCKTPRQRFIEAQKTFMIQRNMRCKSPMLSSFISSRNIPRIDPNDTPEQIIAKRREYWRVKKREQRAKLSMETKARLKERDLLLRRVKRYQKILEEMRRARAQGAGSTLNHDPGTIGGFIKEDGTVTINIPANHSVAGALKQEEEPTAVSKSCPVLQPQNQTDTKLRLSAPVRVNPPQVKVCVPVAGLNKTKRLISIRPRTESTNLPSSIRTVGQLKLTHPQTLKGASVGGSPAALGGCVMKMAVSSSVAPLSCLDPGLTEEERMAKKREYWRIKKREQRAARAARLKQGLLQARAIQRRKIQRQANPVPPNRGITKTPENTQTREPDACGIKQEAAADLNPQPEEAICHPDIKPPSSPSPPPAPQQDPDPALSADSQATTLLAVASMKKLLEESLSSVTESKTTQANVKIEEETAEPEVKPNLMQLFFEKDEVSPLAADLTLEIKSWQPDSDTSAQASSSSPHLKNSPHTSDTPPPDPAPNSTNENSSQTLSNFILNPSTDTFDNPSSPCFKKEVCSPEPPKLHHLPLDEPEPEQKPCLTQVQSINGPSAQRGRSAGSEHGGGLSSLQRKREYWKMMKRQQRARVKARQTGKAGEPSCQLPQRNYQAPGLIIKSAKGLNPPLKPAPQLRSSGASLTAVTSIPTVLVVSPAASHPERSPDTLQVKPPVNRIPGPEHKHIRPSETGSDSTRASESQKPSGSGSWVLRGTDVDSPPSLQTLKPPENPLASINLHPIEPPTQTPTLSLIRVPCAPIQTPTHITPSPPKLAPLSTMVPPKPIPGESEEDFLRRKREYWRVKKKEQRARKAIRERGAAPRRSSNTWRPILPAQELHTQDSDQWVNPKESEHLMSHPPDADPSSFEFPNYTAPIEDESDLLFLDYENLNGEDGPVSDAMWRSRYLMDFDPLNQLLVCMVCGEQQYSHSLEGVRAHIDEAHPDTLNLDPAEHQRILEAWDEQVSQRERFFTSQLQRNSEAMTEAHRD